MDNVGLDDGNKTSREVVEHVGGVAVVALDGQDNVCLVKQYRYPVQEELLEIPAGMIEPGEDSLACAQRELLEETGITAQSWQLLFSLYSSPGFTNELLTLYLARELNFSSQSLDQDESIKVLKVPLKKALEMIMQGKIQDAKSVAGLLGTVQRKL